MQPATSAHSASSFSPGCQPYVLQAKLCLPRHSLSCFLKRTACCRKKDDEVDPEQIRRDMERLKLLKDKRCCLCAAFCCIAHTA